LPSFRHGCSTIAFGWTEWGRGRFLPSFVVICEVLTAVENGDVDLTVPVPVQVKWAGETPVITVDGAKIPGLGTFSTRVLLDGARYAETWSHDEKAGHLFGVIERDGTNGK